MDEIEADEDSSPGSPSPGSSEPSGGNLGVLGEFFKDSIRDQKVWSMKCRQCTVRIKSKPGVTSNFHRHLRVLLFDLLVCLGY